MNAEDLQALRARLTSIQQAEKVTLMLARRSGVVPGYDWRPPPMPYCNVASRREYSGRIVRTHRDPPLPFHADSRGAGTCRVCGQPIYEGGGWRKTKSAKVSTRLTWHSVCTTTYLVMVKPSDYIAPLVLLQGWRCPVSGVELSLPSPAGQYLEVDHGVPLFRVAREHADEPWFEMLRFWTTRNLYAITRAAHLDKCAAEARERAGYRKTAISQEAIL